MYYKNYSQVRAEIKYWQSEEGYLAGLRMFGINGYNWKLSILYRILSHMGMFCLLGLLCLGLLIIPQTIFAMEGDSIVLNIGFGTSTCPICGKIVRHGSIPCPEGRIGCLVLHMGIESHDCNAKQIIEGLKEEIQKLKSSIDLKKSDDEIIEEKPSPKIFFWQFLITDEKSQMTFQINLTYQEEVQEEVFVSGRKIDMAKWEKKDVPHFVIKEVK